MSINDLPNDLIIAICHGAIHKEYIMNEQLRNLKIDVIGAITEHRLIVDLASDCDLYIENDMYEYEVEKIIVNCVKNLSDKNKNTIVYDYGIMKAIKLFYDYNSFVLRHTSSEICGFLENEKNGMFDDMIILIINDEIGFRNEWRSLYMSLCI